MFVVQSTSEPVNENLMELLIFVDALKRASAKTINVIIPYYGYARQDRKSKPREPITSKLVANLLTTAGVNRIVTMDLHADQIQGFFDIPVDHMQALPLMARYFKEKGFLGDDVVVVSPDVGGVKRARKLAEKLDCKIAIIDKRRPKPNVAEVMNLIGEVEGKIAIFIDDMIDTAGTICNAAKALIERGAVKVYACATHAVFSGPAIERLKESVFTKVVVTDSIYLSEEQRFDKLRVLSASEISIALSFSRNATSLSSNSSGFIFFDFNAISILIVFPIVSNSCLSLNCSNPFATRKSIASGYFSTSWLNVSVKLKNLFIIFSFC